MDPLSSLLSMQTTISMPHSVWLLAMRWHSIGSVDHERYSMKTMTVWDLE